MSNNQPQDSTSHATDDFELVANYTFGPAAMSRVNRLREKLGEPDQPVDHTRVFSFALSLAEWVVDRRAEGLEVAAFDRNSMCKMPADGEPHDSDSQGGDS